MEYISEATSSDAFPQQLRGIRVVLACDTELSHAELRRCTNEHLDFCVVGEAKDWQSLAELIVEYVPEVVIATSNLVREGIEKFEGVFPLFVPVANGAFLLASKRVAAFVQPFWSPAQISSALGAVRLAVLETKCQDLLQLLKHSHFPVNWTEYLENIEVTVDECITEIPVEQVRCITAARNYVRLETASGIYQTRFAISEISSQLDPEQFVRIHRSIVVNKKDVRSIIERDGVPIAVTLLTGRTLPVGSTYREVSTALLVQTAANMRD